MSVLMSRSDVPTCPNAVIPGLVPGIQPSAGAESAESWIPVTSTGMTADSDKQAYEEG